MEGSARDMISVYSSIGIGGIDEEGSSIAREWVRKHKRKRINLLKYFFLKSARSTSRSKFTGHDKTAVFNLV